MQNNLFYEMKQLCLLWINCTMQLLNSSQINYLKRYFIYINFQPTFFLWILLDPSYWRWIWNHYIPIHSTSKVLALKGEKYVSDNISILQIQSDFPLYGFGKTSYQTAIQEIKYISKVHSLEQKKNSETTTITPLDCILWLERPAL